MAEKLYKKTPSGYEEIYPLTYIQSIMDSESGKALTSILGSFNNVYVPYQDSVENTRNMVPKSMRRKGLWITYDNGTKYITEYYKGTVDDIEEHWSDSVNWQVVPDLELVQAEASKLPDGIITPDKLSPALQELIKQNNTITNLPDDEDLEERNGVMSLKERKYNPYIASGKGYKILRKNWVKGRNILTQDMISDSNTIYEIRYDYDLDDKEITIPEGCTLNFVGGSFKNGIIQGTNTLIEAGNISILINIDFKGTFINHVIYSIWFGLIGEEKDGTENQIPKNNEQLTFEHIASFIKGCTSVTLEFENKVYGFGRGDFKSQTSDPVRLWYGYYALLIKDLPSAPIKLFNLKINGNGASFINLYQYYVGLWEKVNGIMTPCYDSEKAGSYSNWTSGGGFIQIYSEKILNVQMKDFSVDMRRDILQYGGKQNASQTMNTISIRTNGFIHLDNIHTDNSITDGITTHGKSPFIYGTNISCKRNGRCGWSILSGGIITVTSSKFSENGSIDGIPDSYDIEDPGCNLNVEVGHYDYDTADYVNINHCVFDTPRNYQLSVSGKTNHVDIHDNVFRCKGKVVNGCVVSAMKSAKIHHCVYINTVLKAPSILNNKELVKEVGSKGIVYDCVAYSDKSAVDGGIIFSFGDTKTPKNYNKDTKTWYNTTGVYSYSGYVYNNIDVFLYDKFQIAGSNTRDGYCSIKDLKVHILEKRTMPICSILFDFNFNRNYADKITIYDYVLDEDIDSVPKETYLNNISNNIEIIKMSEGTKPAIKLLDNIRFDSQNTKDGFGRVGNKSVNLLKFIASYNPIYMGFVHSDMIKDIGDKTVIKINREPTLSHQDNCLFSLRIGKTSEVDNTPTQGFDRFFGELKGIPIKNASNIDWLKNKITEKGYTPIQGDTIYFYEYKKTGFYNSSNAWLDANGNPVEAKDSGTFSQKPTDVKQGFAYYCTDKQTAEGTRNGIMIYYAGSNTWVDALGRVVS